MYIKFGGPCKKMRATDCIVQGLQLGGTSDHEFGLKHCPSWRFFSDPGSWDQGLGNKPCPNWAFFKPLEPLLFVQQWVCTLWQVQTSNSYVNRKKFHVPQKNELTVQTNIWWTLLKMWDQMIIPIVSPLQAEPTKLCELHRHFTYDLMSIAGLSPIIL
jgi:hypothetical protein